MEEEKTFYEAMESDIRNADIPDEEKSKLLKNFLMLKEQKINLLITGATGCGKSSTINALFNTEVAKVGVGVDPETMDIQRYELQNLILWDSPGLGDGKEADDRHSKNIAKKLQERDSNGNLLIDLVLVILNGSTRDLGTSYDLINTVIIPNLGDNKEGRILIALNQADVAMGGRYWNFEENRPEPKLEEFLDQKVLSVKGRIKEATGIDIEPIYYSAGFKEEGREQCSPYNLSELLYYIVKAVPKEKRIVIVPDINQNAENFKHHKKHKHDKDYNKSTLELIEESFNETLSHGVARGAEDGERIGGSIGKHFGKRGEGVGKKIGRAVGKVGGAIDVAFKRTLKRFSPFR